MLISYFHCVLSTWLLKLLIISSFTFWTSSLVLSFICLSTWYIWFSLFPNFIFISFLLIAPSIPLCFYSELEFAIVSLFTLFSFKLSSNFLFALPKFLAPFIRAKGPEIVKSILKSAEVSERVWMACFWVFFQRSSYYWQRRQTFWRLHSFKSK